MYCPFCYKENTKVTDSRLVNDGLQVRRRRFCLNCHERFTTFESAELMLPSVIKRDGTCELFSQEKLKSGIMRALEKRPVCHEETERAIYSIIKNIRLLGEKEVHAEKIGDFVMQALKQLDEVAYVRFASVYRCFRDLHAFKKEIDLLESEPEN